MVFLEAKWDENKSHQDAIEAEAMIQVWLGSWAYVLRLPAGITSEQIDLLHKIQNHVAWLVFK